MKAAKDELGLGDDNSQTKHCIFLSSKSFFRAFQFVRPIVSELSIIFTKFRSKTMRPKSLRQTYSVGLIPRRQYKVIGPTKQVFEWGCRLSVQAHVSRASGPLKLIPP